MSVTVFIPTVLRQYADGKDTLDLEGANISELLENLGSTYAALKNHIFQDGALRSFVNVFIEDDNIRDLDGLESPIKDGDEIWIIPAVAGGVIGEAATEGVTLNQEEIGRYSRHLILPEVGMEGQKKLKAASVLLIGAGGLGTPLAMYLAAAGVGRLGIVEYDVVDHSNLHRQIMHFTEDVGKTKLQSAKETIHAINPNVIVDEYEVPITSANALEIVEKYDIVADGTDNFPTRYLVNDACVMLGKPNVYGSIYRFEGQASVFNYKGGPCYRSLYPVPPDPSMVPSCAEAGVLGILPGIVGLIQATETIKIILGEGTSLSGRLMTFDSMRMKFRELKIKKDESIKITELIDYKEFCGMPDQEFSAEADAARESQSDWDILPEDFNSMDKEGIVVIDVREPHEREICDIGGRLIPQGDLPRELPSLNPNDHIVVYCRSGARSANAVEKMRQFGFENTWNLQGGILAWSDKIDPTLPKY